MLVSENQKNNITAGGVKKTTNLIVIMGPPGCGKGTQAKLLQEKITGFKHISTGNLFRAEIRSGSELGKKVEDIMSSGKLVSDEITDKIFISQTDKILAEEAPNFILLDGYPRKVSQAKTFLEFCAQRIPLIGIPMVLEIQVSEQEVIKRLAGRLTNPRTGKIYHEVFNPPKVPMICDEDGGELIKRKDDHPDTISSRYNIFKEARDGMMSVLTESIPLVKINGQQDPSEIATEIKKIILENFKHNIPKEINI